MFCIFLVLYCIFVYFYYSAVNNSCSLSRTSSDVCYKLSVWNYFTAGERVWWEAASPIDHDRMGVLVRRRPLDCPAAVCSVWSIVRALHCTAHISAASDWIVLLSSHASPASLWLALDAPSKTDRARARVCASVAIHNTGGAVQWLHAWLVGWLPPLERWCSVRYIGVSRSLLHCWSSPWNPPLPPLSSPLRDSIAFLVCLRDIYKNCPHNGMKLKQNCFETVLKLLCFSFISLCGQLN